MDAQDFNKLRRQIPFKPFQVRTKEGQTFDAVHSDLLMACPNYVIIGFPKKGSNLPIFETFARVNYSDIAQVDMLDTDKKQNTREPGWN